MPNIMKSKTLYRYSRLSSILLLVASLLVSLVLGELAVRMFYPQKLLLNVSRWDPYVGFVNIPNFEGYSEIEDFKMHVNINSHGLRDREFNYQKPHNTIRIGIFGDSFTFGEGVQNNEAYPKILEELLRHDEKLRSNLVNIEVLNFGIGKTGTSHQYAFYQKEGRKYQLDFVILGFLGRNDFTDNWAGVFYLRDNVLIHNSTAYSSVRRIQSIVYHIPLYKWMATHSHLVNLLRKSATIFDDRLRIKKASSMNQARLGQDARTEREMTDLTLRLIEAFRREVTQNKGYFMVVNLPTGGQKEIEEYSDRGSIPAFVKRCDNLMKSLNKSDIKTLDLIPVFSVLPESIYYFRHDNHMTARGHQVVAANIYGAILAEVIERERQVSRQSLPLNSRNVRPLQDSQERPVFATGVWQ
jgi:lysophospholipase L1-like esterase